MTNTNQAIDGMMREKTDVALVKKEHPYLIGLSMDARVIHDKSYSDLKNNLDGFVDKTEVFIDPKERSLAGLVATNPSGPSYLGRIDITICPELGNLVKNYAFDHFQSQNKVKVTPLDFLRYAISHEYCHLFERFVFDQETKETLDKPYGGYSPSTIVGAGLKEDLSVREGFSHWLAESVTGLSGFEPWSYTFSGLHNTALLIGFYSSLKVAERNKGRRFVLNHAGELLQKSFEEPKKQEEQDNEPRTE